LLILEGKKVVSHIKVGFTHLKLPTILVTFQEFQEFNVFISLLLHLRISERKNSSRLSFISGVFSESSNLQITIKFREIQNVH
jgi:hypothetical protein